MSEQSKSLQQIGQDILLASRNELYLNLPYLDVVLCGLSFQPGENVTLSLATDGQTLYYNGSFLAERYLRGRVLCNRAERTTGRSPWLCSWMHWAAESARWSN